MPYPGRSGRSAARWWLLGHLRCHRGWWDVAVLGVGEEVVAAVATSASMPPCPNTTRAAAATSFRALMGDFS